jgi:hypothetical protein
MLMGQLATVLAAAFAGVAIYISVAEQPARLSLSEAAMLAEWQASYRRAAPMQASVALLGGLLGVGTFLLVNDEPLWMLGGLVLLSAWPFTLIALKPTNDALQGTEASAADARTRILVERWGKRHAVRSAIGATATVIYLLAGN